MEQVTLSGFAGCNLKVDPRLLADVVGTSVVDAQPGVGDLRPLNGMLNVATVVTGRKTLYRMGRDTPTAANYWLSWTSRVSVMRGFDTDAGERIYYSGYGTPKWTDTTLALAGGPYPASARELAVPAPTIMLTLAEDTPGAGDDGTVYYVYTFVNDIGWESAPSPVASITIKPNAIVDLSDFDTAPVVSYGINRIRIYRTSVGTSGNADFLFLREIGSGSTTSQDDARALGDVLPTIGWLTPPAAGFGLIALWNGMAAICSAEGVHISPPGIAYAYPDRYVIAIADKAVATAKYGQNLVVLTKGRPVIIQGQEPGAMSDTLLLHAPCVSAPSVAEVGGGVVWASSAGLAFVSPGAEGIVTAALLDVDQWKALVPSTMVGARWDRFYVGFYNDGAWKGFMIDPLRPQDGLWFLSTGFECCYFDDQLEALFVLDGNAVKQFDGGASPLTATFRSKKFRQPQPRNCSHGRVVANTYPLTLRTYGDGGTLRNTKTVTSPDPFTLKSGFMDEDIQIEVQATGNVQQVFLGNMDQMRNGGGA